MRSEIERKPLVCLNCGGPLFENFVRRFDERLPLFSTGKALGNPEKQARTDYQDGRECRKCRTFTPFSQFPAASERLGSAPAHACDVTRRGDSSCRGVPDGTDGEIVLPVPSDKLVGEAQ